VVKRSDRSRGPYETLATVHGTSYIDRAVRNDQVYYYVVAAINKAGGSGPSPEEAVTPAPSPAAAAIAAVGAHADSTHRDEPVSSAGERAVQPGRAP
jgi:fibronectin type 3 domain-containing protein